MVAMLTLPWPLALLWLQHTCAMPHQDRSSSCGTPVRNALLLVVMLTSPWPLALVCLQLKCCLVASTDNVSFETAVAAAAKVMLISP